MSLVELLVALTVALVVLGAAASAFIQILRASDESEAQVRAGITARSSVDRVAEELRQLDLDPLLAYQQLILEDNPLTYGDNIDNDGDGQVDEELFDGFDDDGDWTTDDDNHATLVSSVERAAYVSFPDFGDRNVDEDVRFSADEITFIRSPGASGPGSLRERVTYRLGTFEGVDHVLLRDVEEDPDPLIFGPVVSEPVAFDVVSFDVLAWNPNTDAVGPRPGFPYWTSNWDAETIIFPTRPLDPYGLGIGCGGNIPPMTPPFKFPAAFLISITVNAERQALADLPGGWPSDRPLRTQTITTIVTVESVISDVRYNCYLREGCDPSCPRL